MTPAEQIRAAQAKVPFAFGLAPAPGTAGGMVHDHTRCQECSRLRTWALSLYAPDVSTQPAA